MHWLLRNFGGKTRDNAAMLAGMGLFTVINYLGQRYLAFRKEGHET
jgi:hypothetical protein